MAQELWLLRHGDAEDHGSRDDFDRRLTAKGERQARSAGGAIDALGLSFATVFSSPRVRALETARLAMDGRASEIELHPALSGGFSREDALELLAGIGVDDKLLLVGHEPDFSQVAHDLTGARADVKKGGLVGIRIGRGQGELLALLRPRELRAIAGRD